jgi:nitronate monooxygenase
MAIQNRLTRILGIERPILLAPMDIIAGGKLAAAVSHAGGLGLLGGGYGSAEWIEREWRMQATPASAAASSRGRSRRDPKR